MSEQTYHIENEMQSEISSPQKSRLQGDGSVTPKKLAKKKLSPYMYLISDNYLNESPNEITAQTEIKQPRSSSESLSTSYFSIQQEKGKLKAHSEFRNHFHLNRTIIMKQEDFIKPSIQQPKKSQLHPKSRVNSANKSKKRAMQQDRLTNTVSSPASKKNLNQPFVASASGVIKNSDIEYKSFNVESEQKRIVRGGSLKAKYDTLKDVLDQKNQELEKERLAFFGCTHKIKELRERYFGEITSNEIDPNENGKRTFEKELSALERCIVQRKQQEKMNSPQQLPFVKKQSLDTSQKQTKILSNVVYQDNDFQREKETFILKLQEKDRMVQELHKALQSSNRDVEVLSTQLISMRSKLNHPEKSESTPTNHKTPSIVDQFSSRSQVNPNSNSKAQAIQQSAFLPIITIPSETLISEFAFPNQNQSNEHSFEAIRIPVGGLKSHRRQAEQASQNRIAELEKKISFLEQQSKQHELHHQECQGLQTKLVEIEQRIETSNSQYHSESLTLSKPIPNIRPLLLNQTTDPHPIRLIRNSSQSSKNSTRRQIVQGKETNILQDTQYQKTDIQECSNSINVGPIDADATLDLYNQYKSDSNIHETSQLLNDSLLNHVQQERLTQGQEKPLSIKRNSRQIISSSHEMRKIPSAQREVISKSEIEINSNVIEGKGQKDSQSSVSHKSLRSNKSSQIKGDQQKQGSSALIINEFIINPKLNPISTENALIQSNKNLEEREALPQQVESEVARIPSQEQIQAGDNQSSSQFKPVEDPEVPFEIVPLKKSESQAQRKDTFSKLENEQSIDQQPIVNQNQRDLDQVNENQSIQQEENEGIIQDSELNLIESHQQPECEIHQEDIKVGSIQISNNPSLSNLITKKSLQEIERVQSACEKAGSQLCIGESQKQSQVIENQYQEQEPSNKNELIDAQFTLEKNSQTDDIQQEMAILPNKVELLASSKLLNTEDKCDQNVCENQLVLNQSQNKNQTLSQVNILDDQQALEITKQENEDVKDDSRAEHVKQPQIQEDQITLMKQNKDRQIPRASSHVGIQLAVPGTEQQKQIRRHSHQIHESNNQVNIDAHLLKKSTHSVNQNHEIEASQDLLSQNQCINKQLEVGESNCLKIQINLPNVQDNCEETKFSDKEQEENHTKNNKKIDEEEVSKQNQISREASAVVLESVKQSEEVNALIIKEGTEKQIIHEIKSSQSQENQQEEQQEINFALQKSESQKLNESEKSEHLFKEEK